MAYLDYPGLQYYDGKIKEYIGEVPAQPDGNYPDMTVGNADQLTSKITETDKEPYLFRTAGGSLEIGDREKLKAVVGVSVGWNQLAHISQVDASKTQNGVTITDNRDGTYTVSTDENGATADTYSALSNANVAFISGHKYLFWGTPSTGSANTYYSYLAGIATVYDYGNGVMFTTPTDGTSTIVVAYIKQGTVITTPVTFKQQCFDLTLLLGSTIADYIYSLETATAGAGVAKLKSWGFFAKDYYAYDAGSIKSVDGVSSHDMVGFNQWDEEWENGRFNLNTGVKLSGNGLRSKNKIRVLPNTVYHATCGSGYGSTVVLLYYDSDENFISYEVKYSLDTNFTTPTNAHYVNINLQTSSEVTTYNHDICINLHWDGERDGEYEEYVKHSYTLDSTLTLRGIPKLDANNQLYYDGDTYEADGTVTRRYGERAYQSGDESLTDAITDGTTTVYKLTTPTTETADPYTETQIVDNWGTEEFVSTGIVPVGHETEYIPDLKAKLEVAPEAPNADGLYLMKRENGENSYVAYVPELPTDPAEDGTYTLKATKTSSGTALAWVAD